MKTIKVMKDQKQTECWECSSHNITYNDDELECLNCGGTFVE